MPRNDEKTSRESSDGESRESRHRFIDFPQIVDDRGSLTYVEESDHLSFDISRVYYLYDFSGEPRGNHAHRELEQVMIALNGGLDVTLDDGQSTVTVRLDDPSEGLYVPPGLWRELDEFETGTVCLVLASDPYDENDYIRDYDEFKRWRTDE